jgi:hypothetical protein
VPRDDAEGPRVGREVVVGIVALRQYHARGVREIRDSCGERSRAANAGRTLTPPPALHLQIMERTISRVDCKPSRDR